MLSPIVLLAFRAYVQGTVAIENIGFGVWLPEFKQIAFILGSFLIYRMGSS